MHLSTLLVPALAATAFAAPTYPALNLQAAQPGGIELVSDYFNMLAAKVQANRYMSMFPVCDLSKAKMPVSTAPLPPVSKGLSLKHVAVGRGTQNYTCDTANTTAVPVPAGAVATLFNVSCVAAMYPDLLDILPGVSMQFNLTAAEAQQRLGPSNYAISGTHFFTTLTTPYFKLDTPANKLGEAFCSKNSSTPAPPGAAVGQKGEPAVPWLKLLTQGATTGGLQEVYRLTTAGGSAPATCKGLPATFQVQYAAQYWFFHGPPPPPPTKSVP